MPTVFITGANRGIGLELARQGLSRGYDVVATARRPAKADALSQLAPPGGKLTVLPLDVADEKSIEALGAALGGRPIDILINNAGVGHWKGFQNSTREDILEQLVTNAMGPFLVTRTLLPNLQAGHEKKVVNVTSLMGSIADNGSGGSYGYRMSKAALNMVTKSLSVDLGKEGISVLSVHPGWVQTDMGGRNAKTPVADAATGIWTLIDKLNASTSGHFFHQDGRELPW